MKTVALLFTGCCLSLWSCAQQTDYGAIPYHTVRDCDTVYALLKRDSTLFETDNNGRTLMHRFVFIETPCQSQAFEILAGRGAEVNAVDNDRHTPLDLAAREKHATAIIKLIALGGKLNAPHPNSELYQAIEASDIGQINRLCQQDHRRDGLLHAIFYWNEAVVGPRINYQQGKHGFAGLACPLLFHNIDYIPNAHYGISAGLDARLSGPLLLGPKISAEYRYVIFLIRGGYQYYTDLGQHEHTAFAEAGFSAFGYADLTYLRVFPQNGNRFDLGTNYFNLTFTLPITFYSK